MEKALPKAVRPRYSVRPLVRRSSCLHHRNTLTWKAWGDAVQGVKRKPTTADNRGIKGLIHDACHP